MLMHHNQQFVPVANLGIGSLFVKFVKMVSKAVICEAKNFTSHNRIGVNHK